MGKIQSGIKAVEHIIGKGHPSMLMMKRPAIHGINPYLIYPPTGKVVFLPRFASEEMKVARKMNKIASRQIKSPVSTTFPKATSEDYQRLTDMSFEASNKRTVFTHPETGKVYNLLHDGQRADGMVSIRVLDEEGAFVKNISVKPKKIVILDNFTEGAKPPYGTYTDQFVPMSHGHYVEIAARRSNPFAQYECINTAATSGPRQSTSKLQSAFDNLQQRIDNGEQIDFLSLSFGYPVSLENVKKANETLVREFGITAKEAKATNFLIECEEIADKGVVEIFAHRNRGRVRVLQAACNYGKDNVAHGLLFPHIEGVGALGTNGKISAISSSRNSLYTQHYEIGVSRYTPTPHGLSFTNGRTTDVPLKPELESLASKFLGQAPIKASKEEHALYTKLKREASNAVKAQRDKMYSEVVSEQEDKLLDDLRKKYIQAKRENNQAEMYRINEQRDVLAKDIVERINKRMKNFSCPELEEYKTFVQKMQDERKLFSKFTKEYFIPPEDPTSPYCKLEFLEQSNGKLVLGKPHTDSGALVGTSFATPVRSAKIALYEMLKGIL